MTRALNPSEIEYTITLEPEDTTPSQGGFQKPDGSPDDEIIAAIEKEMEWNEWAWCTVKVTAKWGGFEGTSYLGQCSYKDEDDFAKGGYLPQMKDDAVVELRDNIKAAGWELEGSEPDYSGVEALLTNLPRTLVGDGKTPNIFFVTNEKTGNVVAVFLGDDKQDAAIAFADSRTEPLMVEDRLTGVVHDNPAGERYQDECRRAEEEPRRNPAFLEGDDYTDDDPER
jgi:hypothetical protein